MEIINEASEKFKDKQDEICDVLFDLLRQMNMLEQEIHKRKEELVQQKLAAGIPSHQAGPGEMELFDEYKERLGEIVKPACTEKLLKRRYGISFGSPAKYGYIDDENTAPKICFIMKTAKRAVVETHYKKGILQMHKFVLRNVDGEWLVDEVYYGFESNPDEWHVDSIH